MMILYTFNLHPIYSYRLNLGNLLQATDDCPIYISLTCDRARFLSSVQAAAPLADASNDAEKFSSC